MQKTRIKGKRLRTQIAVLSVLCLLNGSADFSAFRAQAAGTKWMFDFGGNGAASGYTAVSAADGYSAAKGYGFANTGQVKNVGASGSGAASDAVQFTSTDISRMKALNRNLSVCPHVSNAKIFLMK